MGPRLYEHFGVIIWDEKVKIKHFRLGKPAKCFCVMFTSLYYLVTMYIVYR